jgi:hypothetical protein
MPFLVDSRRHGNRYLLDVAVPQARRQTLACTQCLLTGSGIRIGSSGKFEDYFPHILRGPKNGKSKQVNTNWDFPTPGRAR